MLKIHPSENRCQQDLSTNLAQDPHAFTVWKRSSMSFQGTDGFTVFYQHGRLAFRVDNYTRKDWSVVAGGGGLLLVDGSGNALLTLKPQVLSTQYQWNGYKGGDEDATSPKSKIFTMIRKPSALCGTSCSCQAHVHPGPGKQH